MWLSSARADQGEGLELGVVGGRRALGTGGGVDRVRPYRVVLGNGDAGVGTEILGVGVDVEYRDPVTGRGVAPGRPGGVLDRVGSRPGEDIGRGGRHRAVGLREDLRLALTGVGPVV